MASKITLTNIDPVRDELVTKSSRYANSKVIYYGNNNLVTFPTYKRIPIAVDNTLDKFTVVNAGTEFRPDLISQQAYGLPDFWWKILEVNNVMDIFDFKAGLNIRIPANIF